MSAYRYTYIMQYVSGAAIGVGLNLKGSWSESVYYPTYSTTLFNQFVLLAQYRATLLGSSAYISGIRTQQVDPSGASSTSGVHFQGGNNTALYYSDIPQMALLCRLRSSTTNNVRSMRLAGLPDSQVVYGEYSPSGIFPGALSSFFLRLNGWCFRAQDLTQPTSVIKTIDAAGNFTLIGGLATSLGQKIKVKRTVDAFGNQKGGVYTVVAVTSLTAGQFANWNLGATTGGLIQPYVIIYPPIITDANTVSRVVPRKIGRPSLGYRGRRGRRKP